MLPSVFKIEEPSYQKIIDDFVKEEEGNSARTNPTSTTTDEKPILRYRRKAKSNPVSPRRISIDSQIKETAEKLQKRKILIISQNKGTKLSSLYKVIESRKVHP